MSAGNRIDVPVLIVGAGPTGLSASLLLSQHGVKSLTLERHPGTSIYPRATGINVRSMEIFRSLGLEDEVRRAAFSAAPGLARSCVLVDPEPELSPPFRNDSLEVSPCQWTSCSQYELEPILRKAAMAQPQAQLLFGHELLGFEQTCEEIIAQLADRTTGDIREVRCSYLIAADGSKSPVRERLGIQMQGIGEMGKYVSIHFSSRLRSHLPHQANFLHFVQKDGLLGIFAPTDGGSRWVFAVPSTVATQPVRSERAADLVRLGAGLPDLDVEVLGTVPWTMQADVAERWRQGNVFLAGDAAHRMTPAGGLGLNTGVQDVHNLCWKLAAVIQRWAGPSLLDTYETERIPVGRSNVQRSVGLVGLITGGEVGGESALDVDLGFIYASPAAVSDESTAWPHRADFSGRPGARAPHLWLAHGSDRVSTLDLFGPHMTLLIGSRGETWLHLADEILNRGPVPLTHRIIGSNHDDPDTGRLWRELYCVDDTGAVLVRPDGHIGWKSRTNRPGPECGLDRALMCNAIAQ